jgi:transcription elongation factor Elf1
VLRAIVSDAEPIHMILRIECPSCNHVGLAAAETLPRLLTCSICGASRHVEADQGRAIVSTERFEEYLAGERERPQVRRKAATLATS